LIDATNTFLVDRHPQYRHCPTVTRAIASGIIIIEVQNDHIKPLNSTQLPNPTQPPQEKRKKRVATFMQSKGKKVGTVSKLIHELSRISDAVEPKRQPSSENLGSSIRDVMERVCTLEGVEEGSDLYRIARIF